MDWLEEELKNALARKEPSSDFDARVRAAARPSPRVVTLTTRRWIAAAAAVVVVLAGGGEGYRRHQGQAAKEQVMLAMRITGAKLSRVQSQLAGDRQ
jgi:hypothetical protein